MATMIPENMGLMKNDATQGEKEVYRILDECLDETYFVFYEPEIGGRRSDFVVIMPEYGVLVLEVKDWSITTIIEGDKNNFKKYENNIIKNEKNPLDQAWNNMMKLVNELKKDIRLRSNKEPYLGKLKCAYNCGVVYTNISREKFENSLYKLSDYEQRRHIFSDDLEQIKIKKSKLHQHFKGMFEHIEIFHSHMKKSHIIDVVKEIINPKIKNTNQDIVFKIDKNLEKDASDNQYGRWAIYGTPGSGKTSFLLFRAKYLICTHRDLKILIVCETKQQVNLYRQMLARMLEEDIPENVLVTDIEMFIESECEKYLEGSIRKSKNTVQLDQIINGDIKPPIDKFDAILVDEILNFKEEYVTYLRRIALRDKDNSHFVCTLDGYQNTNRNKYKLKWVGLESNKVIKLITNYRNSKEIFDFITNIFTNKYIPISISDDDSNYDFGFLGCKSLTNSQKPQVTKCKNILEEISLILDLLSNIEGTCAIICFDEVTKGYIKKSLKLRNIKFICLEEFNGTIQKGHIAVATVGEIKGLQFKNVFVLGIKNEILGKYEMDFAKLMYVAFTRAKENLYITTSDNNIYTAILNKDEKMLSLLEKYPYKSKYIVNFHNSIDNINTKLEAHCIDDILEPDNCPIWIEQKVRKLIIKELRCGKKGESVIVDLKKYGVVYRLDILQTKLDGISAEKLEFLKFK